MSPIFKVEEDFITIEQILNRDYVDDDNYLRVGLVLDGTSVLDSTTAIGLGSLFDDNDYYADNTSSIDFASDQHDFGFVSHSIKLENEGFERLEYSFDGTSVHGSLAAGDIEFLDFRYKEVMFIRSENGGQQYYLTAY